MLQPVTAARKLTIDDLFAHGTDVRAELIHGEIVPKAMSYGGHWSAQGALHTWVRRRFDRKPGGRWPGGWWIGSEAHVVYETHEVYCHDLVGWRRDRLPTVPLGKITTRPDWVCEVLSPAHEKRDLVDKLHVMHAAAVPNYWVIDHEERILFLYRHRPEGYVVRSVAADEVIRAEPFETIELRAAIVFGDEDDEE
jgi:Uma2 family endonuclease